MQSKHEYFHGSWPCNMTRSMLQRIRPRSYWYLSDHADQQEHSHIGQILEESSLCCASKEETEDTMKMTASPCLSVEEEKTKPNIKLSLEDALEIQATYTSWSHSIWEPNFEDADGEIVFEFGESELENGDITLKKSVDTADTEEETNPSCSSPTPQQLCQTRIELDALELSDIIDEDVSPIKANSARKDNDGHTHCDLLAFSADLRSHFLIDRNKSRLRALETSTNVNKNDSDVLLIEESFDLSQDSQQDTSICSLNAKNRKRSIRFADEEGKAMETVHLVERQQGYRDDSNLRRILVLLLLPKEKKFEFLHAEYSLNARVSVSVLLKQFPDMATDPIVASQKYTRLCRAGGGAELINALAIQDYGLEQDEILIAVVKGYTSKETNRMAKTLVENQQILKAVSTEVHYCDFRFVIEVLGEDCASPCIDIIIPFCKSRLNEEIATHTHSIQSRATMNSASTKQRRSEML